MPRDEDSSYNYIDFAELARLLAQAAVATPAVVQAPANTAPSAPAVQQAVTQIAQAVVPVIAPTVPRQAILALAKEIADEVVTTPEIIKADTGVSVPPKVIDSIVSEVSDVIPQDVIDSIEKSLSNASAEQVVVPTPSQALDERSQAISEYKNFFGTGQGTSGTDGAINGGAEDDGSGTDQTLTPTNVPRGAVLEPADLGVVSIKSINDMTQEEIDAFTKATVAAGGKSTDPANRLPGESASAANDRITEGYKKFLAKPVASEDAINAGAEVKFVRTGSGGQGEYTVVTPVGYTGPKITTTEFTEGIIPNTGKYTTGSDAGKFVDAEGNVTPVPTFNDLASGTVTPPPAVDYTSGLSVTQLAQEADRERGGYYGGTVGPTGPNVPSIAGITGPTGLTGPTGPGFVPGITGATLPIGPTGAAVQTYTAPDGTKFTDAAAYVNYTNMLQSGKQARQSAYDLLYSQFKQYGLESLVEGIKDLIQKDVSPSQFTIELRNSPAYLKRFAANAARVKAGYKALDEGTYLALEDSYQNLMRNYGLPASYWEKGELGVQPGFEKLIAGNVDPVELEQRLVQAVDQIEKGPKEYMDAIKQFYPEISRGDLMAYVLDPENALKGIQSKVKAAQVGGEYLRAGLGTNVGRAEYLTQQGVTADQARGAIPTLKELGQRGGELADIYARQGLGPYDIATAEEEMYNLGKAAEAKKKRETLTALEQASWSGKTGVGALESGRAGLF
jgi:hypothetical protein